MLNAKRTFALRLLLLGGISVVGLGGCGTVVPEIEDFPGGPPDGQALVQAIVTSFHCEVADAVKYVIDQDIADAKQFHQPRAATWLYNWGAQIALTLTVEEKSAVSPTSVFTPTGSPKTIFTLGSGATVSADATRIEKVNFYYTVAELYKRAPCARGVPPKNTTASSLLIQSDLKLAQWLQDQILPVATGEVNQPTSASGIFKQNVLSHEVKFEVISTGNITPAWKLVQVNFNQSGTFFSATRDRTHDLIVTFGPGNSKGLTSTAAINSHLASEIGVAIATHLQNLTSP
jgi:hypothetical protein